MSASPAPTPPTGLNATTPNAAVPLRRAKPKASAFAPKRALPSKRAPPSRPAPSHAGNGINGAPTHPVANGVKIDPNLTSAPFLAQAQTQNDYGPYEEYSIVISKKIIISKRELLRHHAAKFWFKGKEGEQASDVNPYDPAQFTRPLRLHRRYLGEKLDGGEHDDAPAGVDDKEREAYNARRAEREAERDANKALIAPAGNANAASKPPQKRKNQKKVEDVWYDENDPVQKKKKQLRYEETKPWHLDDFDHKNQWVGSYQEPLSESFVMFAVEGSGFTMVPVERFYQFRQTNRVKAALTLDEAEKHMSKKVKAPRWFMNTQEASEEARKQEVLQKRQAAMANSRGGMDDKPMKMEGEDYQADRDEIDFEFGDEFQDDDEGMIWGEDEDAKDTEKRVREEMREANLAGTGLKNEEKDYDAEEEKKKAAEKADRKLEKSLRKQLIKKEKKYEYDPDDEPDNPYGDSSETEDSDEERERLEKEQKEEEERQKAQANGDKSGASTKGTNTPTGRTEKHDPSRPNAMLGSSLKRPGSPNLSEASGNESNRKKAKVANGRATPLPNAARALSPDAASNRIRSGYGSGSETDTSRAGRPKIRLKASPPGSPQDRSANGSRVVSPAASRAQSPQRTGTPPQRVGTPPVTMPTLDEIKAAIPPEGITVKLLTDSFRGRVHKTGMAAFIALVKQAGRQDAATKKIVPKE